MATDETIRLNFDDAVWLHFDLMKDWNEVRYGLDFRELLDSALARPKHSAIYENADVRLFVVKIMFHLNKQKILVSFVVCLLLSATEVFACVCVIMPNETLEDAVKNSVKNSKVVFAGKVIGFEYRKGIPNEFMQSKGIDYETKIVKFQAEQWWKGQVPKEIFLVTDETKNADGTESTSSCNYNYKEGESYLIFAYGKENELRTMACSRTQPLNRAKEDLKILGEGKEPIEKKGEPNKSMDVRQKQLRCFRVKLCVFLPTSSQPLFVKPQRFVSDSSKIIPGAAEINARRRIWQRLFLNLTAVKLNTKLPKLSKWF